GPAISTSPDMKLAAATRSGQGMANAKKQHRPKYENVQYKPPTAEVFGNAMSTDLPTIGPKSSVDASFSVDRPRNRPKLQDRLAVYEDDNPRCQQVMCLAGMLFPPLWLVGAVMYLNTSATKASTREAGFKNVILSIVFVVLFIVYIIYHIYLEQHAGGATGNAPGVVPAGEPPRR
ncbi:unnamed protein product, partial [Polarella glacialis]